MNKIISTVCAAAMALTAIASTAMPVNAAPIQPLKLESGAVSNAEQIQYRRNYQRRGGFERRGNYNYYNGHRGYRDRRPGYRHYNGFWFPPAAFITGAIIGGALAQPRPVYRPAPAYRPSGNAHVQWCYNRYRSYRAYDNTFQPYNGPRQQCYSPYR